MCLILLLALKFDADVCDHALNPKRNASLKNYHCWRVEADSCCCCCPPCGGGEKASLSAQSSSGLPPLPASIDTATSDDKKTQRFFLSPPLLKTDEARFPPPFFPALLPRASRRGGICVFICVFVSFLRNNPTFRVSMCVGLLDAAQVNDTAHLPHTNTQNDLLDGGNWCGDR